MEQADTNKDPTGQPSPGGNGDETKTSSVPIDPARKRLVVVGLGMVGIAFIEKVMKLDAKRREYDIIVIGEEPHLAYNRVGLTSFFAHRKVEDLYLNPEEWYSNVPQGSLSYHLNTLVAAIDPAAKTVTTARDDTIPYDVLVLATGSDAVLPRHTPGHDAKGVFVYRTIDDLQRLIAFAAGRKGSAGAVVGGGLLGLEAAKAMMDLGDLAKVSLIERNRWVLSRQLDAEAGGMVVEQVRALGLDVLLGKRVGRIETGDEGEVKGVVFEDGERMECSCVCFAIGIQPRDQLAKQAGIRTAARGGIVVQDDLSTSQPDIYAIGECASWQEQTFGLIAPGVEMADVLAFNLTQAKAHAPRSFRQPDVSTKLKLLGVDVASFGDFFADRDGPKQEVPGRRRADAAAAAAAARKKGDGAGEDDEGNKSRVKSLMEGRAPHPVKALTYKDPFKQVYKKYIFTMDGKYLLGGMMIGDTGDFIKLVALVKGRKPLEKEPGELIVGGRKGDEGDEADELPDEAQICSCHNVSKGDLSRVVRDGSCTSLGEVKACTKAGTGCGGCMPLVQTLFNKTMASMGREVQNHLCGHFACSRAELFHIVQVKQLRTLEAVMAAASTGRDAGSTGCEVCKPTIASILASLFNQHALDAPRRGLQDTNDRFLGNIQRNGTFSVVPRVAGGEITADRLVALGQTARKYGLYCKITGGQRVDLFGARKQDLPAIWADLRAAGMESGHAYAKSLRTVKSCVGSTWCRYGVGDAVGLAVRLEERYKSIRAPHKIKSGVSGCVRECAEAQSKDFGLIATDKGYNVYVGGNGGAKPRHADLLARDVAPDDLVPLLDRFLAFYIRTADRLQRTARWIEDLPGGLDYLRDVVVHDKLGLAADLEAHMQGLVDGFFCEWDGVLQDPAKRQAFAPFANTDAPAPDTLEPVVERGQQRPAYWPADSLRADFRATAQQWRGRGGGASSMSWERMLPASRFDDGPAGDGCAVQRGDTQLAVFKLRGRYFATQQMCPHKRAFVLSDGLLGEDGEGEQRRQWVSCPMHKRNYRLDGGGGEADDAGQAGRCLNDDELSIATFEAEERDDGWVYLRLPPVDELDAVLGTSKFVVKKQDEPRPFEKMDRKLANLGKKGVRLNGGVREQKASARIVAAGGAGCGGSAGLDW